MFPKVKFPCTGATLRECRPRPRQAVQLMAGFFGEGVFGDGGRAGVFGLPLRVQLLVPVYGQ